MEYQLSIWKEKKNPVVRMHNFLIVGHFGGLELNEMRIFLLMLAKLEWETKSLQPLRIKLADIDSNIIISEKNTHFQKIVKAMVSLKSKMKDVKLMFEENGKKVFGVFTVIDSLMYREGTDFIECSFGNAIAPYLIQLKGNFTSEELSELLKLKSSYGIRLYMLIKSLYRDKQVYRNSVDEFRQMLVGNLTTYPEYKEFKREVFGKAIAALENTMSAFRMEEEREGRKVAWITLIPNHAKIVLMPFSDDIEALLKNYKVDSEKIRHSFSSGEISEDFIRFTFEMCFKLLKPTHKKIGGFLHDAILEKKFIKEYESRKAPKVQKALRQSSVAVTPPGAIRKREFISLEELRQSHQKSLRKNPAEPVDLKDWIEEIWIKPSGYEVEFNETGMTGIYKYK